MPSFCVRISREGRGVALAVIERAGDDGDGAVGIELDAALLLGHRRRGFDVAGDAEAAQFAGLLALALALGEALGVGLRQRFLEQAGEIAAVIGGAGRRRVRHVLRLDEVAAAQFELVDAEFNSRDIHGALDRQRAFRAAGAAIGGDQCVFENTHLVDTSKSGVRYMLMMFLVTFTVGSSGPKLAQ